MTRQYFGVFIGVFCCLGVGWLYAADRYVSPDSPNPSAPYTNWNQAARTVSEAVALANAAETVWVSNGTHAVANLQLNNAVVRGWSGNPEDVVLAGDGESRVVDVRHTNAQLLDVTISNGCATVLSGSGTYRGGGVLIQSSYNPLVSNCVIRNNYAYDGGGGVYAYDAVRLIDCRILSNVKGAGGSSDAAGISGKGLIVSNCVISGNVSSGCVSGVSLGAMSEMHNSIVFDNNASDYAGGVFMSANSKMFNCLIVSNYAANFIGGIYMNGASAVVANCTIGWNSCPGNAGGIYMLGATSLVQDCLIINNQSLSTNGGGIYFVSGDGSVIESSTLAGNSAAVQGGGLHLHGYPGGITNCIIYGNTGGTSGREDIGYRYGDSSISSFVGRFYYSCAPNKLLPEQGNLLTPPLFVNPAADDYRLDDNSPCINVGFSQPWMLNAVDLDGRQRLDRFTRLPDMGCYEYVPPGMMFNIR